LARVWQEGAYAAPALDAALRRAPALDPRDARLVTELVYGVLRVSAELERRIARHATSERYKKAPLVRAHLLIAAYSLAFLERVPSFAAVDSAVGAIREVAAGKVAGFANAVLRKLAQHTPDRQALPAAVLRSTPRWLASSIEEALGADAALFFEASSSPPPLALCLRAGEDRARWQDELARAVPEAEVRLGAVSPRALLVSGAGDPARLPGKDVAWTVQEEGAQVIALSLGAQPGERVLDACAGRGGKTLVLAEQVGEGGVVDAADRHPQKLARLSAGPFGARVGACYAVDWTAGTGDVPGGYDRLLVDAPCSGVGTLRRRPEIAERLAASDVTRLKALQLAIVLSAARCLRPGGRLVYAVCSVLGEEAEEVVAALAGARSDPRLEPAPFDSPLLAELAPGASSLRLLPARHGTDGYFLASFVKR
jgi:16S rRNA (cytosine967-C5)-methyltransferase